MFNGGKSAFIKHWPLANSTSPGFVVDAWFMFVLIIISGMGSTGAHSHMWHSDNKVRVMCYNSLGTHW